VDSGGTRGLRRLDEIFDHPPTPVAPEPHRNMQLYISAMSNVVSTTIIVERGESDTNRKIQYAVLGTEGGDWRGGGGVNRS
jgi:hypothetical protein